MENAARAEPISAANDADAREIEEKLAKLKTDMKDLGETLKAVGKRKVRGARGEANQKVTELIETGETALDDLRRELDAMERSLEASVREAPLKSLAIAAGLGFLAAIVLRR